MVWSIFRWFGARGHQSRSRRQVFRIEGNSIIPVDCEPIHGFVTDAVKESAQGVGLDRQGSGGADVPARKAGTALLDALTIRVAPATFAAASEEASRVLSGNWGKDAQRDPPPVGANGPETKGDGRIRFQSEGRTYSFYPAEFACTVDSAFTGAWDAGARIFVSGPGDGRREWRLVPISRPKRRRTVAQVARPEAHLGELAHPKRDADPCPTGTGRVGQLRDGPKVRTPKPRPPRGSRRAWKGKPQGVTSEQESGHTKRGRKMTRLSRCFWWLGWDSNPRPRHYECQNPVSPTRELESFSRNRGYWWAGLGPVWPLRGMFRAYSP